MQTSTISFDSFNHLQDDACHQRIRVARERLGREAVRDVGLHEGDRSGHDQGERQHHDQPTATQLSERGRGRRGRLAAHVQRSPLAARATRGASTR